MFRLLTSRPPQASELDILENLYQQQFDYFRAHEAEAEQFLHVGELPVSQGIDLARLAAAATVANALFSFDDVQMMR